MLFGQGEHATIAAQINYDPVVNAQIGAAAVRVWKALPNKTAGDQLSKVVQGSSEPYTEFVSCQMQLAGKIFGEAATAMSVIKQLAFENANKYCKEFLRAHKNKSLNDMIRLCRDIDGNYITGQVFTAAIRQGFGRDPEDRPKGCFGCGQQGNFRKDCPNDKHQARSVSPGVCQKCKKGSTGIMSVTPNMRLKATPYSWGMDRGAQVYGAMNAT
ncbi:hypothetical protein STEG23_013177 [Scotinomys teguina]